jgi:hypothetical protein
MKPITKVFIVIGALLLCLLIWAAVFNNGLLQNAWNSMADSVNEQWQKITGDNSAEIIPEWDVDGTNLDEGNSSF